jgi:hypothetical protein
MNFHILCHSLYNTSYTNICKADDDYATNFVCVEFVVLWAKVFPLLHSEWLRCVTASPMLPSAIKYY